MENISNIVGEEGIVKISVFSPSLPESLLWADSTPWGLSPGSRTRGPGLDSSPAKLCDLGLVTKPS